MDSTLEIHLLGPFRVAVDGSPVDARRWSRRSAALLIKLLALQPHRQLHREQAMEMLWPELEPHAAINNLHKTIHAARRALEPALQSGADSHFIITHAQQIILRAPGHLWIDVDAFQQQAAQALNGTEAQAYERALALYAGDLLIEDLYEDWAAARREQLRALRQDLLADLARLHEAQGHYPQSIERLKELLVCEASNEEAHRHLIRLYAQTGSRHQALQQYRQCRASLRRELDAEPDQATVTLYEQIVAGQIMPLSASKEAHGGDLDKAIDSLAILPLVNATADPQAEYLSDGITESIINSLSQLRRLRVMARSTVFRYKDREVTPQEIGRDLSVGAVMTGRVLQLGDTLIIRAELVDTSDGSQLWGGQYNRRMADIFAVQEEIAKEVSAKLRLRLTGEEQQQLARHYTENPEAYRLYLKGRYYWNKRTEEGLKKAVEYFNQAINGDGNYALAYVGLADAYALLGDIGVTTLPPNEAFSKARAVVAEALELDSRLAEAHTSLAHLHMHNFEWASAGREFQLALELGPNYATTHHWYAFYSLIVGRADEVMPEIKRALELDPLSVPINTDFGELLYFNRQYDQAIEESRKALEMEPYFFRVYLHLGRIYLQQRRYQEAIAEFLKAKSLGEDNPDTLAGLGHAYAMSGNRDEALDVLRQLQRLAERKYVSPYDMALVYSGLGENDQAMAWLYRAYEERAQWMIFLAVDLRLEALHSDPRFRELVERVGLKPPPTAQSEPVSPTPAAHDKAIDSLAILPLINDSGDANLEYLSDGVTESIINNLSQLPKLRVMAWSTVRRYKGSRMAPQAIGRELGVRAALIGRVLQLDEQLVIKTELVKVADGSQLWGEHYNRQRSDIFALQEEIANEISEKLRLKLSRAEKQRLSKRYTDSTTAYHAYLKGRYCWYKRTEEGLRKGIDYFNQAIDQDPAYALAYDGLSDSYALLALRGVIPAREAFPKSKAAARKALEIDDGLGEAYASLAHVRLHDWDWAGLEAEFKRAIELSPGHAIAYHWYSEYLMAMGRSDESIAIVKPAQAIDPLSPVISVTLATAYYFARMYDQAIEQTRKGLELNPDHFLLHFELGQAYLRKGMYEEAIAEMQRAVSLSGRSTETLAGLGKVYAAAGMREAMQKVLDELIVPSTERYVSPYNIAKIYAAWGDHEQAFAWLEKAYAERHPDFIELNVEPVLDSLRRDRRFTELLQRVGFTQKEPPAAQSAAQESIKPAMPKSIAVLPFKPISLEGRDEYLEMGIADALITRLSNLSRIIVRSISSVRKFTALEQESVTAGRELKVESVLEGSIQKLGERMRVTARLVRVEDGSSLWADKFDEKFTDIFAVEDSISEKVAAALTLKLSGDEKKRLTKRYTENTEAYHAYLRGRYYWNKRTDKAVKQGMKDFKQAIDMDPCYALAHAGLADSYLILGAFGISTLSPKEAFPRAQQAAVKALEIDDGLAEAHTSLALSLAYYDWNWSAAEREFKRSIELKPGYATAHHWYAFIYLTAMGRLDEAIAEMKQAQALEPLSLAIDTDLGFLLYLTRRYDQAIDEYQKTIEIDPSFVYTHWKLGLAYEQKAMYDEAIAELKEAVRLSARSAQALVLLGHAYAVSENRDAARAVLGELHESSRRSYVSPYRIAAIYVGLGESEPAFAWLERAYVERDAWLVWLKVDPVLDPIRHDPRFQDLLRRVGLAR